MVTPGPGAPKIADQRRPTVLSAVVTAAVSDRSEPGGFDRGYHCRDPPPGGAQPDAAPAQAQLFCRCRVDGVDEGAGNHPSIVSSEVLAGGAKLPAGTVSQGLYLFVHCPAEAPVFLPEGR